MDDIFERIHRINYLMAEMDALYHQASLKIGIADSAMTVLYTIHDNGENCLLSNIYKQSGISKQTVNSAIRKLEGDGILYLESYRGRSKRVRLTDKGREYLKQTAARLFEAERRAYESWTKEEIDMYICLLEKYADSLRVEIQKIDQEEDRCEA